MIQVTKLDGTAMFLNGDWIQSVEMTPDTVITLTNGIKVMVKNTATDIIESFKRYKRETTRPLGENQ